MDISDILASVSAPAPSLHSEDLQALTRAWANERVAPELLQWPGELMDRVMAGVGGLVSFLSFFPPPISQGWRGGQTGYNVRARGRRVCAEV